MPAGVEDEPPTERQQQNHHEDITEAKPEPLDENHVNGISPVKQEQDTNGTNIEGPALKRRKLADGGSQRVSSRAVSPPWKKIAVEGPTSFIDSGKRRSARTNIVPLELQPPSGKRQTRAANHQAASQIKNKYGRSASGVKSSPLQSKNTPKRQLTRPTSASSKSHSQGASRSAATPRPSRNGPASSPVKQRYSKRISTANRERSSSPLRSPNVTPKRRSGRPVKAAKEEVKPTKSGGWRRKSESALSEGTLEDDDSELTEEETEDEDEEHIFEVDPNITPQRLNLKVRLPELTPQHPLNIPIKKHYATFREWIEQGNPFEGPDPRLSEGQVHREARSRLRLIKASEPGGVLSGISSQDVPENEDEPPRHYFHYDHVLAHALDMQRRMEREKARHMRWAKKISQAVMEYWKELQPKTEEDLQREKEELVETTALAVKRQCIADLSAKWDLLRAEVEKQRQLRYQQEREVEEKEKLNKVLKQSTQLLDARMRRDSLGTDEADSIDAASGTDDLGRRSDSSKSESEDESNMSTEGSDRDDESEGEANDDQDLSPEELRRKYYTAPPERRESQNGPDTVAPETSSSAIKDDPQPDQIVPDADAGSKIVEEDTGNADHGEDQTEEAPSASRLEDHKSLLDDTDESIDMDDDMGDTEDESEEDDDEGSSSDAQSDGGPGLLGFFSKDQIKDVAVSSGDDDVQTEQDIPSLKAEPEEETSEVSIIPDATQVQTPSASNSEAASFNPANQSEHSPSKQPSALHEVSHPDENSAEDSKLAPEVSPADQDVEMRDSSLPATPVSSKPLKTAVPSLLRGTLREYQHFGLDWLAGLYAGGTNGILADEMGLGKTIQTIALLAHLAVEHEVWGPHLIVVPTSVMLNWEMEFKKFLPGFKVMTYYGTQDERKQKRKGWLDDDKWNVVISSYQLVLQDQISFKKRGWHYLVLDEAHNIKNFRSQRWQALLTFRTAARLLLTGTPLQNNLTELWSLMFFLMPSDSTETGIAGFADLKSFTNWFKKPVDQILEQGRDTMDAEAQELVRRLHEVLRPYLLRRLKADVEKQMPAKYEHVIYCKLSKRQRHLYDGFMSRTQTRETLASGNYLSIINCLMQLRKVCNHPDLFETRPIVTSFAMSRSAVADYEIKELLLRRRLLQDEDEQRVSLDVVDLLPGSNGPVSALDTIQPSRLGGIAKMRQVLARHSGRILSNSSYDGSSVDSTLAWMDNQQRINARNSLHHRVYLTSLRSQRRPLMSYSLVDKLRIDLRPTSIRPRPSQRAELLDWFLESSPAMKDMIVDLPSRYESLQPIIQRYSFVTPAVVAPDMASLALSTSGKAAVRKVTATFPEDSFHESRMRLSIAFPDKRLLQFDCGKLQRLDGLLRTLQAGGHRALIFTQMTKVLDILEQFLNIHGYRYLRLDGSTKIEQRQILTDRFNNDPKILAFILSSRSGGLGINLTGADSVIFYDLDWNPAMDKQCQDRCHRIGQTRDVHIYRFVSEYTIEANILRKANQKRLLDDVIIQDGGFTADYFYRDNTRDDFEDEATREAAAEASAAMDKILGNDSGTDKLSTRILEQAEDKEDARAAKVAEKEVEHADEADFSERPAAAGAYSSKVASSGALTPAAGISSTPRPLAGDDYDDPEYVKGMMQPRTEMALEIFAEKQPIGVDLHMVEHLEWELRNVPIGPPPGQEKKKKKGPEHKVTRKR